MSSGGVRALLPRCVVAVEGPLSTWQGALRAEEQAELDGAGAKRRAEYTAGRRCAREALSRLGVDGFPLLSDADRLPAWPPGVVGSISHGADYCVAAVAHAAEVAVLGVDVERGGPLGGRVAARVLADAERQRLAGLPPLPGGDWAKLAWSAKEAAFKAAFPVLRRRLAPREIEIVFEPEAGRFRALLAGEPAEAALAGRFAVEADRVLAAVAAAGPEGDYWMRRRPSKPSS